MTIISRTSYSFSVLHRSDQVPVDLEDALAEASTGHAIGIERRIVTAEVDDDMVAWHLREMGNDGSFFDDDLAEVKT